jgi:hypothetical protein
VQDGKVLSVTACVTIEAVLGHNLSVRVWTVDLKIVFMGTKDLHSQEFRHAKPGSEASDEFLGAWYRTIKS